MVPPPKAKAAIDAMKALGFDRKDIAHTLKKLLDVYEQNYEYIEEDNYRVLLDKLLEEQELKAGGHQEQDTTMQGTTTGASSESSKKRQRTQQNVESDVSREIDAGLRMARKEEMMDPVLSPANLKENITDDGTAPTNKKMKAAATTSQQYSNSERLAHTSSLGNRRETRAAAHAHQVPVSQENTNSNFLLPDGKKSGNMVFKEPKIEPGTEILQEDTSVLGLKDREVDADTPDAPTPIAIIYPPNNLVSTGNGVQPRQHCSSTKALPALSISSELSSPRNADKGRKKPNISDIAFENGKAAELVGSKESSATVIDIASSDTGEVELKFFFKSGHPGLQVPSLESIVKIVEERCLKSYKLLEPNFSLMKIMKEMCRCATELITEPTAEGECATALNTEANGGEKEKIVQLTTSVDFLNSSGLRRMLGGNGSCAINGYGSGSNGINEKSGMSSVERVQGESSHSLAVIPQPEIALGDLRPNHDPSDITKGEERFRVPLVNQISNERFPSSFNYIPVNISYQSAYLNFTLARIGDEDCCSDCFGDCVAAKIPCPCAQITGGQFAYTADGLVKEEFLDDCILMKREPQKHHYSYCQDCPLEKSKKDSMPDLCKGHLTRRFIKECWVKCGCTKQCGNRVVQRGIACNLQVFYTPEGKGWGLRALDGLPKGSYVCEYVGEVLTNSEINNRRLQSTNSAYYPVLLDAGWGPDSVLKDEEALCLDATFYGNVARFINHRCTDANLVEIPVEVESPDHHYYHVALFTTKEIQPLEELTWDYGINFDEQVYPVKSFKCRCGSKFCRDKRRSRSRSKALI